MSGRLDLTISMTRNLTLKTKIESSRRIEESSINFYIDKDELTNGGEREVTQNDRKSDRGNSRRHHLHLGWRHLRENMRVYMVNRLQRFFPELFEDIKMYVKIAATGAALMTFFLAWESIAWFWPGLIGDWGWVMWFMLPFMMISAFLTLCYLTRLWRKLRGTVEGDDLDPQTKTESALDKTIT